MRTCRCDTIDATEHCGALETFVRVRDHCPALKQVLIPDGVWPEYHDFCSADPDEAHHAPVAYLAFKRRHLARLTKPIHLFCLKENAPHASLTKQYRNDLAERWMFEEDVKQRFRHTSMFQGRLAELLFAAWLRQEGWRIGTLEALGGVADVVATCPLGRSFTFEVKFIGQDQVLFDLGINALGSGGAASAWIPVYSPIDYLLFRAFEAARQLRRSPNPKIVVMVLSDYETYFGMALSDGWINWRNTRFFRREADIENFLADKYHAIPNLDCEIRKYISQIDQIWFYDMSDGLMISRRKICELYD